MAELSANVAAVADQVTQASLQAGQQIHALAMQNAVHMQQLVQMNSANIASGGLQVGQAYQGNHLRRGSEIDSQEATAEGAVYKGESLASFPQTGQQLDSQFHKNSQQNAVDVAVNQILAKLAQSTSPQTAGHAAQAPSGLGA